MCPTSVANFVVMACNAILVRVHGEFVNSHKNGAAEAVL